jgi:hypothetical protein
VVFGGLLAILVIHGIDAVSSFVNQVDGNAFCALCRCKFSEIDDSA